MVCQLARVWSRNQQCSRMWRPEQPNTLQHSELWRHGPSPRFSNVRACVMRSVPFIMKAAYRCHEGCTPGSDERQRTQLWFKGHQGLEVVPSSSEVCSCFVLREGGASRRSSWNTVSTSSIQASGRSCGQATCPTRRRPTKSHPGADAAFNVTRRRDGRTEHVLWFRWESSPPQEERLEASTCGTWKHGNVGQIDQS